MFDIELTKHIAELSKIAFTDTELKVINNDMSNIILLMDKIKEFDSNNPLHTQKNVQYTDLREDFPVKSLEIDSVLSNAKKTEGNNFVVPKVV